MARPNKNQADYFPHFVKGGRTVYILENLYGNDGYAFWFKLLEQLCDSENQVIDFTNPTSRQFLLAKTRVSEETAARIIQTLIELEQIDAELWGKGLIWVQNLVDNLVGLYERRRGCIPTKEQLLSAETPDNEGLCMQKPSETDVSVNNNPHSIEEKSIVENSRDIYPYQQIVDMWNATCKSLPKVKQLNDNRRKSIKCRLQEFGKGKEAWIATAEALFEAIEASDFLTGRSGTWQASFDWVFKSPNNWVKVMEGNYDNKGVCATTAAARNAQLGVGEFIDGTGRRTYGTGKATIPPTAPPRPSERYCWSNEQQTWILL